MLDTASSFKAEELNDILKAADLDGTGNIDAAEFRGAAILINSTFSDDDIKTAFMFFDKDNCGHITQ